MNALKIEKHWKFIVMIVRVMIWRLSAIYFWSGIYCQTDATYNFKYFSGYNYYLKETAF